MADDISFNVEGLAELEQALLQLEAKTGEKVLKSAGKRAMKPVEQAAIEGAGFNTGKLRESITTSARKGKGKSAARILVGPLRKKARKKSGVGLDGRENAKAIAQEYGTSRQQAEPFLRPALDKNARRVLNDFADELGKEVDKVGRG